MASVVPIFDESDAFIGIWAQNRAFSPSFGTLAELVSLAEPTLQALTKNPCRRVPNDNTDVGNAVRFEGGVFLMLKDAMAPNEELSHSDSTTAYVLIDHHGIACLKRCSESDERIKTPPPLAETNRGPVVTADAWFNDPSVRGGPHSPADFNLFELPRSFLDKWAYCVAAEPRQARCTVLRIRNIASVTHTLFDAIKANHQLDSRDAVALFDEYLGAACPKCFGGLTGNLLQTIATASSAGTFVGGGAQLQRILSGRCASCESEEYYIVWHGDKESVQQAQPEGPASVTSGASERKWWQFWR